MRFEAKENARPVVGATGQAGGKVQHTFHPDCTADLAVGQFLISDFLSVGQANAVNLHYLRSVTGLKGRDIRRLIQRERLGGIPICADNMAGYYLPANDSEKMRCARSMHHRAAEIDAAAKAIEAASVPDGGE